MDKEYTNKLEDIIKSMLTPLKSVPLNLVIEGLSGNKILPFDKDNYKDLKVLEVLKKMAEDVCQKVNNSGIAMKRVNEVGNAIEVFVKDSLNNFNYDADTPKTKNNRKKAGGYPDVEFIDEFDRISYLECKTFNIKNVDTTFRTFYLSPSEDFKVTKDARHFLISFEIIVVGKKDVVVNGKKEEHTIYKTKSWKILSIEKLDVGVKYEFNANNKELYNEKNILAEGIVK